MINLHLDIETLPTDDADLVALFRADIEAKYRPDTSPLTPPANFKDPAKIEAWFVEAMSKRGVAEASRREKIEAELSDRIAKTSFDGAYGRLACIGFALDDGDISCCTAVDEVDVPIEETGFVFDEEHLISNFFAHVSELVRKTQRPVRVVGHHIEFDIRFLTQRAIVLGVKLPRWWPRDPKPWSPEIYDLMTRFAGAKGSISQDRLCRVLGIEGKGDVDGSMVAWLWERGDYEVVREYCADDVWRQREVFRRIAAVLGDA